MSALTIQPKVTKTWELTPDQLMQLVAAELDINLEEVNISMQIRDVGHPDDFDDRLGPNYQFCGVRITSK